MQNRHTNFDLIQMQSLPLDAKIQMTRRRIQEFVDTYGIDGVYISFSGGKDSTVLLDIARKDYPEIRAMFVNTPTQYPELLQFAKTFENVDIVDPKMGFKQVVETYGYPFFSKEVSQQIYEARTTKSEKLRNKRINGQDGKSTGKLPKKYLFTVFGNDKYEFSHKCCHVMKKNPAKSYEHSTGRKPITGLMAEESTLRKQSWIKHGCNAFDTTRPKSMPMSFWTEQDVLKYIKVNNLPICSVYGKVVEKDQLSGQLTMFMDEPKLLETTGCDRTGCIACGFGCHLNDDQRFVRLKRTHPGIYEFLFKGASDGGLGYKELIDWINKNGKMNIDY